MTRIWFTQPGPTRRLYLTINDDGFEHLTARQMRRAYWHMRRAGIPAVRARFLVYEVLHAGRHCYMGEGYR